MPEKTQRQLATPSWANQEKIQPFYEEAARLTQLHKSTYHVHHIDPINGRLVCGLNVHNNLRVVSAGENQYLGNKFIPYRLTENGEMIRFTNAQLGKWSSLTGYRTEEKIKSPLPGLSADPTLQEVLTSLPTLPKLKNGQPVSLYIREQHKHIQTMLIGVLQNYRSSLDGDNFIKGEGYTNTPCVPWLEGRFSNFKDSAFGEFDFKVFFRIATEREIEDIYEYWEYETRFQGWLKKEYHLLDSPRRLDAFPDYKTYSKLGEKKEKAFKNWSRKIKGILQALGEPLTPEKSENKR